LNYLWLGDSWELRVGIGKVFWGVTEFVHLVDIINQTDLVEDIDGEDKLGQPMVDLSLPMDWGTIDLFILAYFRERTFPGPDGRLRSPLVVDTDNPMYESGAEERHVDFAVRYSQSIGDWEIGLSHFRGTGREPTLLPGSNEGQADDDFFSGAFGFEYTFSGIFNTPADVGVIAEYIRDERGEEATTPFQSDVAIGVRLSFNDPASSEALIGVVQDVESSARLITIEASRRFGSTWKANLELGAFSDIPSDDPLYGLREDDYLRLELAYYF